MSPIFSRADYETEFVCLGIPAPPEVHDAFLKSDYPKNTTGARHELLKRGFAIDAVGLDYIGRTAPGITTTETNGRTVRLWSQEAIDFVADWLIGKDRLSDEAYRRRAEGISAVAELRAWRAARAAAPGYPEDPAYFERQVRPGLPEEGVEGCIQFVPLPPAFVRARAQAAEKVRAQEIAA